MNCAGPQVSRVCEEVRVYLLNGRGRHNQVNNTLCRTNKNHMKNIIFTIINLFSILIFFGCSGHPKNNPADLKSHINNYERLIGLIQKECKKGEEINTNNLSKEIINLMDTLKINSIAYFSEDTNAFHQGEPIIRLCGEGNVFSGDSCFTYNYGDNELEIRNNINSGCERYKVLGKWYKDYIYFD
jgi:hypothetical protein